MVVFGVKVTWVGVLVCADQALQIRLCNSRLSGYLLNKATLGLHESVWRLPMYIAPTGKPST